MKLSQLQMMMMLVVFSRFLYDVMFVCMCWTSNSNSDALGQKMRHPVSKVSREIGLGINPEDY